MYLICGEVFFDFFGIDIFDISIGFDVWIGGFLFNVVMGFVWFGEQVVFFGGVLIDVFGEKLVKKLKDEGVLD